jgi:hypothetical protein
MGGPDIDTSDVDVAACRAGTGAAGLVYFCCRLLGIPR